MKLGDVLIDLDNDYCVVVNLVDLNRMIVYYGVCDLMTVDVNSSYFKTTGMHFRNLTKGKAYVKVLNQLQ